MADRFHALRAQRIIAFQGEDQAHGLERLEAQARVIEDGVVLCDGDRVAAIEPYVSYRRRGLPPGLLEDLGKVCLAPGLINAHCHLELSHLEGATEGGRGFAVWLRSLIAALGRVSTMELGAFPGEQGGTRVPWPQVAEAACARAMRQCFASGVAHIGDVGSRYPGLVHAHAATSGLPYPVTHLLEAFGFEPPNPNGALPAALAVEGFAPEAAMQLPPEALAHCAVAGHALYSTRPEALRAASSWCRARARPFSLHLAESAEEEACLKQGQGDLHDLFSGLVLPPGWQAPGLGSVAYADRLGLLHASTLAVHCVHCSPEDIALLARRNTRICLCPRSNAYIGVGTAPARRMAEAGLILCLGTDGLSSVQDLDMRKEVMAVSDIHGFSPLAGLRMATLNGAAVFGLSGYGTLAPGSLAAFSIWELDAFA